MSEDGPTDGDGDRGGGNADEQISEERAARLQEKERRLESQEENLESRKRELDQREAELEEWEEELTERRDEVVEMREQIEDREKELAEQEDALEARQTALNERERELEERAAELDRKEETLREYVGDQFDGVEASLSSTVRESVDSAVAGMDVGGRSAIGMITGVIVALIGVVLVAGGAANAVATQTPDVVRLFSNTSANIAASAVLIFLGLAANLAAASGRV